MAKKRLAIGIQAIEHFKAGNLLYVDKTEKIHELMEEWGYPFIVRPRRFGKSLLLSTLGAIYQGKKELFEGTWIYDKIDWEAVKRPVLRIDFTAIEYHAFSLEQGLQNYLRPIARGLSIDIEDLGAGDLFKQIIETLGKEQPIIILIDEYEMPVTDFVGKSEKEGLLQENIFTLKKFYGTMKGMSAYIHRSYITGVSKIGQIGILSDLNMLNDLTLDARFTTLFGYTETELRKYYAEYITEGAAHHQRSEEDFLAHIKRLYNGYSWDGIEENKVYNPFSIACFFQSYRFENYWFATGTPTVLVRGARKNRISIDELEHFETTGDFLKSANLRDFYSESLLFQAGYLTIKEVKKWRWDESYILGFPNDEVRNSFAKYLLAEYVGKPVDNTDRTLSLRLRICLEKEQLKEAFAIFSSVIASVAYDITKHTEGFFHTVIHVLMYSTGLTVFSEIESAQGRLDLLCEADSSFYIFEFKLDETAETAISQIKKKNYHLPYLLEEKKIYIIGVNFLSAEKKINDIAVEKWNGQAFERAEQDFLDK